MHIGLTPNFVGIAGVWPTDLGTTMVNAKTKGERITITGTFDGAGAPVRDGLIEIWQADADGLYPSPSETRGAADPEFHRLGPLPADGETGEFRFETVKPGAPFPRRPHAGAACQPLDRRPRHQPRAQHAPLFRRRGRGQRRDPILNRIEPRDRAATLIASRSGDTYRFDIHLQGPQ